jgi:uncharacterized membrane protein (UPF0127 family)
MTSPRFTKARFQTTRSLRVSPVLTLEVAHTAEQRYDGLMGRAVLPQHHGMLFVFPTAGLHGFWMKNTSIPLDLAWLSPAGVVQETVQLFPYDERLRVPRQTAKYVIELPAGAFEFYDVRVGDQLVLF